MRGYDQRMARRGDGSFKSWWMAACIKKLLAGGKPKQRRQEQQGSSTTDYLDDDVTCSLSRSLSHPDRQYAVLTWLCV